VKVVWRHAWAEIRNSEVRTNLTKFKCSQVFFENWKNRSKISVLCRISAYHGAKHHHSSCLITRNLLLSPFEITFLNLYPRSTTGTRKQKHWLETYWRAPHSLQFSLIFTIATTLYGSWLDPGFLTIKFSCLCPARSLEYQTLGREALPQPCIACRSTARRRYI
jgi:hypothetical protein